MRELVVISGKGGTGKTSLMASFAVLSENTVLADCDVDAADLHLVLSPRIQKRTTFQSGREASIREDLCTACGACLTLCRFGAIEEKRFSENEATYHIDPSFCEGCGVCAAFCPKGAVEMSPRVCGQWMISETRAGTMVHARLGIAAENSGLLVSTVKTEARKIAEATNAETILIDGPPGIGCPVIASLSGASHAMVVTEPTLSGLHDLERVLELTNRFVIPTSVCINKWDLSPEKTAEIETYAATQSATLLGRIRYDAFVTEAQKAKKAVVETNAPSAEDIRSVWEKLKALTNEKESPS